MRIFRIFSQLAMYISCTCLPVSYPSYRLHDELLASVAALKFVNAVTKLISAITYSSYYGPANKLIRIDNPKMASAPLRFEILAIVSVTKANQYLAMHKRISVLNFTSIHLLMAFFFDSL